MFDMTGLTLNDYQRLRISQLHIVSLKNVVFQLHQDLLVQLSMLASLCSLGLNLDKKLTSLFINYFELLLKPFDFSFAHFFIRRYLLGQKGYF
jgi:hypothetical protein